MVGILNLCSNCLLSTPNFALEAKLREWKSAPSDPRTLYKTPNPPCHVGVGGKQIFTEHLDGHRDASLQPFGNTLLGSGIFREVRARLHAGYFADSLTVIVHF